MRTLFFLLFSACLQPAFAQQFGGNPTSVKWRQINTPAARVIFPQGLDTIAASVSATIAKLSLPGAYAIGDKQRKINILLQNQTTVSNGYVGLGPFRSEFYLTPTQNSFSLGSLPWHEQLVIHEYRHVQQYNNFNVGLSRIMRTIFGEEGQALANGAAVPDWFFEGDAVFNETQVSRQGRGRLPYFFNGYRALWAAGKDYSWMKLRNGSYRDYTPDHYPLGYLMVAYGYERYGSSFWENTTHDAASFKGLFYPFQRAVKKYSGKEYTSFRKDAIDYFRKEFDSLQQAGKMTTHSGASEPGKRLVTDREYPAYINDSSLVFVRSGYNEIPAFVIRTGNTERKLRVKDVSDDSYFSYRNNRIVYASNRPDARWSYRSYGIINVIDIHTGKQHTLTARSKYFSPDINEDGTRVVAVNAAPDGKNSLHILDAMNGKLLKTIANPDGLIYTYPKFYTTGIISAVRNKEGKMSLALIHETDGTAYYLLPLSYNVLGFPVIAKDTVYFTASLNGNDRLFALSIKSGDLSELSFPNRIDGIGAYQPAVTADKLLFTTFTATGFALQEVQKGQSLFTPVSKNSLSSLSDLSISALQKGKEDVTAHLSTQDYKNTPYSKSTRLFNFHSLEPLFDDPDYRLSLVGENILNTLQSELYVNYNRDEQFKQFGFNAVYGAWFPYISLGTSYIVDRRAFLSTSKAVYWNEAQVNGGISVPLDLSKGRSLTSLTVGSDYVIKNVSFTGAYKNQDGYTFSYMDAYTSFSHQIQMAKQHIYPRLAQAGRVDYNRALTYLSANQFETSGSFYWPGLWRNHSFMVNLAYHQRDTLDHYAFSERFPFSRGYEAPNLRNMFKWGANYQFPLAYPDAGVGDIVYLLRVRANLFYDYTTGKVVYTNGLRADRHFRSAGSEIFFDTRWWNQFPVSFGFRYSHLQDPDLFGGTGVNRFEFILPVNLFQK